MRPPGRPAGRTPGQLHTRLQGRTPDRTHTCMHACTHTNACTDGDELYGASRHSTARHGACVHERTHARTHEHTEHTQHKQRMHMRMHAPSHHCTTASVREHRWTTRVARLRSSVCRCVHARVRLYAHARHACTHACTHIHTQFDEARPPTQREVMYGRNVQHVNGTQDLGE